MAYTPVELATTAGVADMEACGSRPDRDLLWRLMTAVGADPVAPAHLFADGVRVECVRVGWVGEKAQARGVDVRVTYFL